MSSITGRVLKSTVAAAFAVSAVAACGDDDDADAPPPDDVHDEPEDHEDAEQPHVMATDFGENTLLLDGAGMAVYVYAEDEPGTSNCDDECAEAWPPVIVEGEPVAVEGVDEEMLGTAERADGSLQLTYNEMPIYLFADDSNPGEFNGHGMDDAWFVVDAETGEPLEDAEGLGDPADDGEAEEDGEGEDDDA